MLVRDTEHIVSRRRIIIRFVPDSLSLLRSWGCVIFIPYCQAVKRIVAAWLKISLLAYPYLFMADFFCTIQRNRIVWIWWTVAAIFKSQPRRSERGSWVIEARITRKERDDSLLTLSLLSFPCLDNLCLALLRMLGFSNDHLFTLLAR